MLEESITEGVLRIAAKRGLIGASRDDLYKVLGGIPYNELEKHIEELEQKGYITIDWLGWSDFVIMVTREGKALVAET